MARFSMMRKRAIDLWKGFAADFRLMRFLETEAPESVEIKEISREEYNKRYETYQQELREFRWGVREQIDRKKNGAGRQKTADNATDASQGGKSKDEKDREALKLKAENRRKEMERKKLAVISLSVIESPASRVCCLQRKQRGESFKRESIRRRMLEEAEDKR